MGQHPEWEQEILHFPRKSRFKTCGLEGRKSFCISTAFTGFHPLLSTLRPFRASLRQAKRYVIHSELPIRVHIAFIHEIDRGIDDGQPIEFLDEPKRLMRRNQGADRCFRCSLRVAQKADDRFRQQLLIHRLGQIFVTPHVQTLFAVLAHAMGRKGHDLVAITAFA